MGKVGVVFGKIITCLLPLFVLGVFNKQLVLIAPKPFFARFSTGNNGVAGAFIVGCGMLVRAAVATQGYAALLAGAQVYPAAAGFNTFLAYPFFWGLDLGNGL